MCSSLVTVVIYWSRFPLTVTFLPLWMLLTFSLLFTVTFKSCNGLCVSPARDQPTELLVVLSNQMQKFLSAVVELQEVSISPFFHNQLCSSAALPYRMSHNSQGLLPAENSDVWTLWRDSSVFYLIFCPLLMSYSFFGVTEIFCK